MAFVSPQRQPWRGALHPLRVGLGHGHWGGGHGWGVWLGLGGFGVGRRGWPSWRRIVANTCLQRRIIDTPYGPRFVGECLY